MTPSLPQKSPPWKSLSYKEQTAIDGA